MGGLLQDLSNGYTATRNGVYRGTENARAWVWLRRAKTLASVLGFTWLPLYSCVCACVVVPAHNL
jgi:hypothetical protein